MKKIGILGGSFDPVHNAHIKIAQKAIERLKLDQVLFVPCHFAPHWEGKKVLPVKHRVAMLKKVLKEKSGCLLSLIEIKRKGISYTIETLKALKKEYPKGTKFYFILGSDSWSQLPTWKNFKSLIKLSEFVVFNRKGTPFRQSNVAIRTTRLRMKPIEVSSTQIRDRVKKRRSIKTLVPREVEEYIKKNKLYK